MLAKQLDVPVFSLATPLKSALTTLDLSPNDPDKKELCRELMQEIAGCITARDTRHFVDLFIKDHPDIWETGCVVDDLRRQPEYDFFSLSGFVMVKLCVSPETQVSRGASPGCLDHPTETALDEVDDGEWDWVLDETTPLWQKAVWVIEEAGDKGFHVLGGA